MKTSSIDEVIRRLTSIPKSLKEATGASGLPREPGLYAWWTVPGSISDVPHCPHQTLPDLDLFYVGMARTEQTTPSARTRQRRSLGQGGWYLPLYVKAHYAKATP